MDLFQSVDFIGHSGKQLNWKIECDAISDSEWWTLAKMIVEYEDRPFQAAIGIPRGGNKLERWLNDYSTQNADDPYLICDDVLTTGGSFHDFVEANFKDKEYFGWCVFARSKPPLWVNALFRMP